MVCLEEIIKEAYPSEHDLFYTKAAIDMLAKTEEPSKVEFIINRGIEKC